MTAIKITFVCLIFAAFLTSGYLGSAQAFSITAAPSAAYKSFVPSESYELQNGIFGVVTRQPIAFASVSRGGTENFLTELKSEFPESDGWNFLAATDDLKGAFSVSAYYVFVNGTDVSGCGGGFAFDYIPHETDPVAGSDIELHWIQRVVSNHKRGSEHGVPENRISFKGQAKNKKRPNVPFFDVVPKGSKSRSVPPHFEYDAGKNDPENEHQWNSEVYLAGVNKNDPKTVTIYNGVSWGWENKTSTVPSPVGQ